MSESKPVLLVVDDVEVNLMVLVTLLRRHFDVEVISATDGQAALDIICHHRISAVFMDCDMPVMDGLEATKRIRQLNDPNKSHLPIVAITANVASEHQRACLDAGMDGFITKPLDIKAIKNVCARFNCHEKIA